MTRLEAGTERFRRNCLMGGGFFHGRTPAQIAGATQVVFELVENMHVKNCRTEPPRRTGGSAFTLAEVVIAVAIIAMVFTTTIMAYTQATKRAQWSGYSLAAQALAIQQVEQVRSAQWDLFKSICEITNIAMNSLTNSGTVISGFTWTNLDLPYAGSNYIRATNFVTVKLFYANNSTNIPVMMRMTEVDTAWPFTWGTTTTIFTNKIVTYCAPDN